MTHEYITQTLLTTLEQAAVAHQIDIIDVEIVGASKAPVVRVRIDHDDPNKPTIGLDEVTQQTSWISEVIDELDPFVGSYTLEVSSPGLSRPLRRLKDFERFAQQHVALSTTAHEGRRRYTGQLLGVEDGRIVLEVDGERFTFALEEINRCTLKPQIDFSGANSKILQ